MGIQKQNRWTLPRDWDQEKIGVAMNKDLEIILNYLREKRGFDFSGYRPSMINRRLMQRFSATGCKDRTSYLQYLQGHPDELDRLVDALTINVSRFFRNTLTFEYIADRVLPVIAIEKKDALDHSLRVWSAGCSTGEEPYSVAILINEFMRKEELKLHLNIFATDIEEGSLKKSREGVYPFGSIKNVKYRLLKKYFTIDDETYTLNPEIKELVSFSVYDMLDSKTYVPPESVFGGFDMVLCRNVLIYFQAEYQDRVFDKLLRSLAGGGYLVLGEAEMLPLKYQRYFQKENEYCRIYRKHR